MRPKVLLSILPLMLGACDPSLTSDPPVAGTVVVYLERPSGDPAAGVRVHFAAVRPLSGGDVIGDCQGTLLSQVISHSDATGKAEGIIHLWGKDITDTVCMHLAVVTTVSSGLAPAEVSIPELEMRTEQFETIELRLRLEAR